MGNETDSQGKNNQIVSQSHRGSGDNVARDKNVYHAISPLELQSPVRNILTSLRHRNSTLAKEQLKTLEGTSSLNNDALAMLDIIKVLVVLADGQPASDTYQNLSTYISSVTDTLCMDIARSAQIRLDVKAERKDDARQRFSSLEESGVYTKEVFYEFIAHQNEVESTFSSEKVTLDEVVLSGLFRGSLRLNKLDMALRIANHLDSIFPSFNSKVYLAVSKVNLINNEINNKHIWCISATLRREVFKLCDTVVGLLNDCRGKDTRSLSDFPVE